MPGHFGYLHTHWKEDETSCATAAKSLIYNDNHVENILTHQHFSTYLIKDKREHTSGIHKTTKRTIYIDGEIYKNEDLALNKPDELNTWKEVDGYFTAIVLDDENQGLSLITDRFGIKPLYIYEADGILAWSTEIKAFTRLENIKLTLDLTSIEAFLELSYMPGNMTLYKEVKLLPASTILKIDLLTGARSQEQYWDWSMIQKNEEDDFDQAVNQTTELLKNAISSRQFSEEKTTVALSGGMDSRALLCGLNKKETIALTFGIPASDDVTLAGRVSKTLNIPHKIYSSTQENWLEDKEGSVWRTEGMFSFFELHSSPFIQSFVELGDTVFNGFGGATLMGGLFMGKEEKILKALLPYDVFNEEFTHPNIIESVVINHHMRRRVNQGSIDVGKSLIQRKPYMDHILLDYIFSLPKSYRENYRLFSKVLERICPKIILDIPWENTMVSIRKKKLTLILLKIKWPTFRRISGWMKPAFDYKKWQKSKHFEDYCEKWVFNNKLLKNSIDPSIIDLAKNNKDSLGRLLSFSIWLHQSKNQEA